MQPYGIFVWADLAGLSLAVGLWFLLGGRRGTVAAKVWMLIALSLSGLGSLSLVPQAVANGDHDVLSYHLAWVVASLGLATDRLFAWRQDRVEQRQLEVH